MRYAQRATFVKEIKEYNRRLSKETVVRLEQQTVPCFFNDLGIELSKQVFGDYAEGRKIVRLQQPHLSVFDFILLDGQKYQVDSKRQNGCVFYVSRGD